MIDRQSVGFGTNGVVFIPSFSSCFAVRYSSPYVVPYYSLVVILVVILFFALVAFFVTMYAYATLFVTLVILLFIQVSGLMSMWTSKACELVGGYKQKREIVGNGRKKIWID